MINGSAPGREGRGEIAPAWRALVILVIVGLALWWGLEQAPQPAPLAW
jgi:hypothetical protein